MSDFASAAMMRLVRARLERQNIAVPQTAAVKGAVLPLTDKRHVLKSVAGTHGPILLLRIAEVLPDMPEEPALTALCLARNPEDLIARWQRLERYIHSRHRIHAGGSCSHVLALQHVSTGTEPPEPEEDLLVFAVLTALMEQLKDWRVDQCAIGEGAYVYRGGFWQDTGRKPAGTDRMVVHLQKADQRFSSREAKIPIRKNFLKTCRALVTADPAYSWTVGALAGEIGMSTRSLQRHLNCEQTCFSRLVMDVRTAMSAQLLSQSVQSSAEIGYCCGFADQAHFVRSFKRHTAMTPDLFRRTFSADNAMSVTR